MTYMIDARLEQGAASLTLVDALTGERGLYWRAGNSSNGGKRDWLGLFKRLMLLSCADQISLVQRAKSMVVGEECTVCIDQGGRVEAQHPVFSSEAKNSDVKNGAVSLLSTTE
ncbi:MAG: hypothetical protein COB71_00115 [Thiotrichales bacterium]|nr:MAG: hypothetical protein COB71_00115 [Thiotrichales bacterium]